jgi:hypothetical protein
MPTARDGRAGRAAATARTERINGVVNYGGRETEMRSGRQARLKGAGKVVEKSEG